MSHLPSARATIPIRLFSIRGEWEGEVEAQGTEHLRIRVKPQPPNLLPEWRVNETLDCILHDGQAEHQAKGKVIKQDGQTVWIRIPAVWNRSERRAAARVRCDLSVAVRTAGGLQIAKCLDLAPGGMRLRIGEPLPLETPVTLRFRLPGCEEFIELAGIPTRLGELTTPKDAYETGIRFDSIAPEIGAKLARIAEAGLGDAAAL